MALIATVTLEIDDNGHATGEPRRFRLKATPTPEATQRALLDAGFGFVNEIGEVVDQQLKSEQQGDN